MQFVKLKLRKGNGLRPPDSTLWPCKTVSWRKQKEAELWRQARQWLCPWDISPIISNHRLERSREFQLGFSVGFTRGGPLVKAFASFCHGMNWPLHPYYLFRRRARSEAGGTRAIAVYTKITLSKAWQKNPGSLEVLHLWADTKPISVMTMETLVTRYMNSNFLEEETRCAINTAYFWR